MENIKEVIKEYATVGVVMSCFMFAIRTYVSVRQSVRDTAIVFLFTVIQILSKTCSASFPERLKLVLTSINIK